MDSVNPLMMVTARESRGYTQAELSNSLNIVQGTLSKAEHGQIEPSRELIEALAEFLRYPIGLFYEAESFWQLPVTFYRKRVRIAAKTVKATRANLNLVRMHLQTLLRSADVPDTNFARVDLREWNGDVEGVAKETRIKWNIPPGPIDNLTRLLEDAGVLIKPTDFGTTKIDGLSIDPADLPPTILMNRRLSGDRWRFTLAHEFAHILFHHHLPAFADGPEIESQANRYASELLMPTNDIKSHLSRPDLKKLAGLKLHWKVSMQSLIEKAFALKRISLRQRQILWAQMGKLGYRLSEPFPIPKEEPTLLHDLICFHLQELGYTEKQLANMLYLTGVEFRNEYMRTKSPDLRVVGTHPRSRSNLSGS